MNWLKQLRQDLELQQTEIAEMLGVTASYLSDVERGNRWLSTEKLVLLAKKTGRRDLVFRQVLARGEFTLPVPEGEYGQDLVFRLLRYWSRMDEGCYEKLGEAIGMMQLEGQ